MQKRTGIRALLLAVCVLLTVAVGVGVARAAESYALNLSLANEEFVTDLSDAGATLKFNVYKVATGEKDSSYDTYNYTMESNYVDLQADFDELQKGEKGAPTKYKSWQELYDAAAELAEKDTAKAGATGTAGSTLTVTVSEPGIYLVLPDPADEKFDVYSEIYGYEFLPTMVALPGKEPLEEGEYAEVGTAAEYGEWLNEITIALKASRSPLFGSLQITKNLPTAPTKEPVSFSFTLTDAEHNYVYKGVLLTIPVGSTTASTTVTHIPAGYTVTVTEDTIAMSGYSMTGSEGTVIEIVADEVRTGDVPVATFTNEPTTPPPSGGHGIENLFTWDPNAADGAGDWVWTSEPVQQQNAA